MIEIIRGASGRGRSAIIKIDGQSYRLREYAEKYGLTVVAVKKRLERGSDVLKPLQRRVYE